MKTNTSNSFLKKGLKTHRRFNLEEEVKRGDLNS